MACEVSVIEAFGWMALGAVIVIGLLLWQYGGEE